MILIVDFGSQTAHLILRRIKELGAFSKLAQPERAIEEISKNRKDIEGIILSGGPASVYQKNAPAIDPEIFNLNIPILGICYGLQLTA
ncbi:MAG: GMP synthase (glutamine-hydrolyzing), partial [Patescibacteria group bacterium]